MKYEGKYLHMVEEDDFWLEVPRNQHTKEYGSEHFTAEMMTTLHGSLTKTELSPPRITKI